MKTQDIFQSEKFMTKFKKMKAYVKAKRFAMYALRWQLSTPVYALVLYLVSDRYGYTTKTIIANLFFTF